MREAVLTAVAAAPETREVVLDASAVGLLDVTTSDVLIEVAAQLRTRGIGLWMGGMQPSAHAFAERSGLAAALGEDHIQLSLRRAVRAAEQASRGEIGG
jgi:anti-anti-sigma regulatory factor